MSNITLIIPTYRNPKVLNWCLKSAVENRFDEKNQILVVVDGFVEESKTVIDQYRDKIQVVELEENVGFARASNIGSYLANTDWICHINDDNVMGSQWDARLFRALQIVGYNQTFLTIDQVESATSMYDFHINNSLGAVDNFHYDEWIEYEKTLSKLEYTENGNVYPFAILKKHYMAVGGLDADTYQQTCQIVDYDFFLKLQLLNFKALRTHYLHIWHFGSTATRHGPDAQIFRQLETNGHSLYEWKWGIPLYNGPNNTKIPTDKPLRGIGIK